MAFSTIRVAVGRVFLVAGVLVLLFIPYVLWGTGLITAHAQDQLRQEFATTQRLHHETTSLHPPVVTATPPALAPTIAAPAPGAPVGIIAIPRIALSMVVVEGTDADQLRSGPGHYPGTPLPGQAGNAAIAGHRTTYLHPFYDLNDLVPGDTIDVLTVQGLFVYHVVSSRAVAPTDVSVVAPTDVPTLTLTTCNPRYSASQRLVVQAHLVADVLTGATGSKPAGGSHPTAPVTPIAKHWWQAVLLGLLVAGLAAAVWALALRVHRGRRAAVVAGGLVVWLGVVFLFFGALAPLLPASF